MAEAPKCRVCGVREWGHVCRGVPAGMVRRVAALEPVRERRKAIRLTMPSPLVAPEGVCEFCDRRRAADRERVRRHRERKR